MARLCWITGGIRTHINQFLLKMIKGRSHKNNDKKTLAGWWFQIFFMFTPNLGERIPILTSICFKWVGSTTKQTLGFSSNHPMGVSKNRGTPQIIHFDRGFPVQTIHFWGFPPIFGSTPQSLRSPPLSHSTSLPPSVGSKPARSHEPMPRTGSVPVSQ